MSILETFYILFKSDAGDAAKDIADIDKAADGAERSLEGLDKAFKDAARNAKELTLAADRARAAGASNAGDLAKQAKDAQLNARALGLELDKTKDAMRGMDKAADDVGASVVQMGKNLLAPAAILASLGKLSQIAIGRAAEIRELDQFSSKINSSISDVDAFQRAVKGMGGETAGAVDSLVKLGEKINEAFSDGESAARKDFEAWGVAFKDAEGAALGASDGMLELAANLETVSRAEALARIKKLGIEDAATIDLLLKGRAAVEAKIEAEKRLGVVTEEQARLTREYYSALGGLGNRLTSLGNSIVSAFIPSITGIIGALSKGFDWLRENQRFVEGFFIGVAGVVTAIYLPAIVSAAVATLVALAPFIAIGAVIAAVGAAFALAYDDVRAFMDGQPSLIGALADKYEWFGDIVDGIGALFVALKDGGVVAMDALAAAWDLVVAGAGLAWDVVADFFGQFEPLVSSIAGLLGDIGDLFLAVGEKAAEGIGGVLEWLVEKFEAVRQVAADFLAPLLDYLQPVIDVVNDAAGAIEAGFVGAFNAIKAVWDKTLGAIVDGIGNIAGRIRNLTSWIRGEEPEFVPETDERSAPSGVQGRRARRQSAANDNAVETGQRLLAQASGAPINGQTAQSIAPEVTNNDIKNTVEVGSVTVHTQAVDAQGVAAAVDGALKRELRGAASQFDDGVAR